MKKIYIPLLTLMLALTMALAACSRRAGPIPDNPFGKERDVNLPVQNFTNAFDAYNFGKKFFDIDAKNYETIFYGVAHPLGNTGKLAGDQINCVRRYKSSSGDFMYDTSNYSLKGGIYDRSFSLITAIPASGNNVYYKKIDGKGNITREGNLLTVDYSSQSLSTLAKTDMDGFKDVSGVNPTELLNYVINSGTATVKAFNDNKNDYYRFTFELELNEDSHVNYRRQIKYTSGYDYTSFGKLNLKFSMDKYGRILKIEVDERYSVKGPLGSQSIELTGTQYFTFSNNPVPNYNGFTVTYQ